MKTFRFPAVFVISTLLISLLFGCSSDSVITGALLVQSKLTRDQAPDVSEQNLASSVEANNSFAMDFYHKLTESNENVFFSPFSLSQALSMAYAGAGGETEKEMADVLHIQKSSEDLFSSLNKLDILMNSQKGVQLTVANSVWAQKGYPWRDDYLDLLKTNFGTGVYTTDFTGNAATPLAAMNTWVDMNTQGYFKNVMGSNFISKMTRICLLNAVYFNGKWGHQFKKNRTKLGHFQRLEEGNVQVPLMHLDETRFKIHEEYNRDGEIYSALEMPYKDSDMAMLVIVPDISQFTEFDSQLTNEKVNEIVSKMEDHEIEVVFPKLEFNFEADLVQTLSGMGMTNAFEFGSADFSKMADTNELYISNVLHRTYTKIDEEGTVAVAFTGISVMARGPSRFRATSPFIFMIRDTKTGLILFMGRIMDPSKCQPG